MPRTVRPQRNRESARGVLAAVTLGAILAPLNSTMIAVALPRVVDDFDSSVGTAGWLVTSYLLALAVVQPVAGKLGDRYGRRPFVIGGLAAFGLASVGAALAPTLPLLIAFRVAQAISGAVVFPNGAGLVRELVPGERRAAAFGLVGAALSFAAALGPPIGGLLVAAGSWRAIFLLNIPFVAAALLLAWRTIPTGGRTAAATPFDWFGSTLFTLVLGGSAALVVESRHTGPAVPIAGGLLLAAAGVWFVRRGLGHADPVVQPRLFVRRSFSAAALGVALSNLGFYTMLIATPILLERREDWSSLRIGLALMLLSAPTVALSRLGGRVADRVGRRRPAVAGCVVLGAALVPVTVDPGLPVWGLFACLAAAGAGVGLSSAGMQTAAVEAVGSEDAGTAAGIYSTSRYVGSFIGSIVLARLLDGGSGLDGFTGVFAMACVGGWLSAIATLGIRGRAGATERDTPARELESA